MLYEILDVSKLAERNFLLNFLENPEQQFLASSLVWIFIP